MASPMQRVVVKPSSEATAKIHILQRLLADCLPSFTDSKCSVQVKDGVIEVDTSDVVDVAETISRFSGVAYAALAERVDSDYDEVLKAIVQVGKKGIFENERFTVWVEATRSLNFEPKDLESLAISTLIGEVSSRGAKPDEKNPDKIVYALVTKEDAYIFTHRYIGFGGLPCGSLGGCLVLVEPSIRSLVCGWLTQRAGFDADYLIINYPSTSAGVLYQSFEVFTLLRRCMPKRSVQAVYFDASKSYRSGEVGLGYSWFDFAVALAIKAAKEVDVSAISLPLNLIGGGLKAAAKKACEEGVDLLTPASFLTSSEMLTYADKLGLRFKLPIDFEEGRLGVFDSSGRPLSSLDSAAEEALKGASKIKVEKGFMDPHEIVDTLS